MDVLRASWIKTKPIHPLVGTVRSKKVRYSMKRWPDCKWGRSGRVSTYAGREHTKNEVKRETGHLFNTECR